MKKLLKTFGILLIVLSLTACGKTKEKEKIYAWGIETFFSKLPAPAETVSDMIQFDKDKKGKQEYVVYVNEYSYKEFYTYISQLEKRGFNYEHFETNIPPKQEQLADKTEVSWGATKDDIYIRALWRSNDNPNYRGYNLQLIFKNYNYLKKIK